MNPGNFPEHTPDRPRKNPRILPGRFTTSPNIRGRMPYFRFFVLAASATVKALRPQSLAMSGSSMASVGRLT